MALTQLVTGERVSSKNATPIFAEVATKWFDEHASGGISNADYRRQVFQQVRDYAFPALGERPVNLIKRAEIVDAIRDVWLGSETVGKRLRGNIERVLDFAVDRGWCEYNAGAFNAVQNAYGEPSCCFAARTCTSVLEVAEFGQNEPCGTLCVGFGPANREANG
jgi:hypothetical protein